MEAMARDRYGLEINSGPFGINSRPALVGAKFAEAQGVGAAFHDAVFRAYWQDAKNIEDLDVLAELATAVGLNRDQFLAALNDPTYQQAMLADVQQAFQYGLSGVPALVYNNKYLVSGAQPYELLVQVAEKAAEEEQ
jgi:predicted DsbA family dithiol-disulfide isomerase